MARDGEIIQGQHFFHREGTICHPKSGYVTTKLHGTSTCSSSSTMRFIHINEYEYMNNYVQYIILHTRIRMCIYGVFIHCNILTIMLMLLTFSSKGSSLVAHLQCMMCDL